MSHDVMRAHVMSCDVMRSCDVSEVIRDHVMS